jgi:hypothetical protein
MLAYIDQTGKNVRLSGHREEERKRRGGKQADGVQPDGEEDALFEVRERE